MSDIELVIKMDDQTYNNFVRNEYSRTDVIAMHTALLNGIPLPKGHGDLIDRNELAKCVYEERIGDDDFMIIDQADLYNAPTIIEADKE